MDALDWLCQAGVTVERARQPRRNARGASPDEIVVVSFGEATTRFAVEERRRAPYPNELPQLDGQRRTLASEGEPLLMVPFVSEALGAVLTGAGWSWADSQGNFDLRASGSFESRTPSLLLKQRRSTTAPTATSKSLPTGSGSNAIIRALIKFGVGEEEEKGASALAAQAQVSQPRASQVLDRLHRLDLVERTGSGRWRPNREELFDRFLEEYSGPGGSERYFYSIDPILDVAVRAGQLHDHDRPVVVSADVGPDLVVPWRRPTLLVLYAVGDVEPAQLRVVDAQGAGDANVIIRRPTDKSVFPSPEFVGDIRGSDVYMADASQMIWDLQSLGGADRLEAAGRLREWLLTPR
jgi:hypothetical protein